jgi:hypothetical protein
VVIVPDLKWKLSDGTEVPAIDDKPPSSAIGKLPFIRVNQLKAVDAVDSPAANRSGLFSESSGGLAENIFADIDQYLSANGVSHERALLFATRYFAARGITIGGLTPPQSPKGHAMKPEELKALRAKHPDHAGLIVDMFADGKGEVEIIAAIKDAQTATLAAKTEELLKKAEKERADFAASLQARDDQIKKLTEDLAKASKIADLGKGAPAPIGGLESDEGTDPSSDMTLERKWATDKELRAKFFDDKEAFIALSKLSMEPITVSEDGKPSTMRSLAPRNPGRSGWEPIKASNIVKPEKE